MGVFNGNLTRVYWKEALEVNFFRNDWKVSSAVSVATSLSAFAFEVFPQEIKQIPPIRVSINRQSTNLFTFITNGFRTGNLTPHFQRAKIIYLPNIQLGGTELFMSQILIAETAIKTLLLIAIFFLQL